jgi:hypothetical protein
MSDGHPRTSESRFGGIVPERLLALAENLVIADEGEESSTRFECLGLLGKPPLRRTHTASGVPMFVEDPAAINDIARVLS